MKRTLFELTNNPANIRYSSRNPWQGQNGSVNGFVRFQTVQYGIRALLKILLSYSKSFEKNNSRFNVHNVIYRFAPPFDGNDTERYVRFVVSLLKRYVSKDVTEYSPLLFTEEHMFYLCFAICRMETNYNLPRDVFHNAYYDLV